MKLLLCAVLVTFAWVQARVGDECETIQQCDDGECCQILSEFMVVSRKRQLSLVDPVASHKGTCQLYKTENQTCSGFEKINGYCGCAPDLQCYSYQVPISETSVGKRSMLAPNPGYTWRSQCLTPATIEAVKLIQP